MLDLSIKQSCFSVGGNLFMASLQGELLHADIANKKSQINYPAKK